MKIESLKSLNFLKIMIKSLSFKTQSNTEAQSFKTKTLLICLTVDVQRRRLKSRELQAYY